MLWLPLATFALVITEKNAEAGQGVPPKIQDGVVSQLTKREGTRKFVISCPVTADPPPFITWKKDGENIGPEWTRIRLSRSKKDLKIKNLKLEDSGKYSCEAVNGFGRRVVEFTLHVYGRDEEPPGPFPEPTFSPGASVVPFFIDPASMTKATQNSIHGTIGQRTLDLKCPASGRPQPQIQWLKNGIRIKFSNNPSHFGSTPRLHPNQWTLQLRDLKDTSSGRYTCRVFNDYGRINATFDVVVSNVNPDAPRFDQNHPYNRTIREGDTATFLCRVHSKMKPHIKWVKKVEDYSRDVEDNSTLFQAKGMDLVVLPYTNQTVVLPNSTYENTLTIPNVKPRHIGLYICVVNHPSGHMVYRFASLRVHSDTSRRSIPGGMPIEIVIGILIGLVVILFVGCALYQLNKLQKKDSRSGTSSTGGHRTPPILAASGHHRQQPPPPSYPPPALPNTYKMQPTTATTSPYTPHSYYLDRYHVNNGTFGGGSVNNKQQHHLTHPQQQHLLMNEHHGGGGVGMVDDYDIYDAGCRVPLNSAIHQQQQQHQHQQHHQQHQQHQPQPYELHYGHSDSDYCPRDGNLQPYPSLYSCR